MLASSIIDTDALGHVAIYGILGAVGLVIAFSVALLGFDRAEGPDAGGSISAGARAGWLLLTVLGGAACLALLGVGVWAMTQK
jgi:hypothetical protein